MLNEFKDSATGLKGFIAIDSLTLGPAVGGTRMLPYHDTTEAKEDVLRLAHAMTYKCAIAGMSYGGGKGVIICHPKKKTLKLLRAYAQQVQRLNGSFYTGEDVGITEHDVQKMLEVCPFFIGKSHLAGDPSPYAALSTFYSMKVAAKFLYGNTGLKNRTIAIKGIGKVGGALAKLCADDGASLIIADISPTALKRAHSLIPKARIVSVAVIQQQKANIYAPCALGNEFTETSIKMLNADIICGGANNQLASEDAGRAIQNAGILYVPDFVANAGGLINVVDELEPNGYNKKRVLERIKTLGVTLEKILSISQQHLTTPDEIAKNMVHEILKTKNSQIT